MSLRAVLLLSVLIPSIPLCFWRPFYGVILWTIVAFASPQWYAWGSAFVFPTAELVAIPTIAGFLIFNRGWSRLVSRETFLLLLLILWFTVTSISAASTPLFQDHVDDMWLRYQFVLKVILMTIVTIGIVDSMARLRILFITLGCCFSFYVVKALPAILMSGMSFRLYGPPRSMVEDNNDLGLALNMTLPILFFLAQTETKVWSKRLFWFLFLVMIPGIFCTYSRGALVGLLAVMLMMFLRLKQRTVLIPVALLGVIIVGLFAPESWKDRMNPARKGAVDNSAFSRLNSWTFAWRFTKDYPLTGGGFETFTRELFARYAANPSDVHGPHSIYFGVLAEHGFFGLALYMGLVVSCFATGRRIVKWADFHGDEVAAGYANMCQFSIVGFLTSGLFLGRAYFDYYYTIVACLVILKKVAFAEWAARDSEVVEVAEQVA